MSLEPNTSNDSVSNNRWKTYLWVLIVSTALIIYTALQFIDLVFNSRYISTVFRSALLIPATVLITAWAYWILMFGIRMFVSSNRKFYHDEDAWYEQRRLNRHYKILNLLVGFYYIAYLVSLFFLISSIAR